MWHCRSGIEYQTTATVRFIVGKRYVLYVVRCKGRNIHPTIRSGNDDDNAIFTITHIFPNSGKYKSWVDFKPKEVNQIIAAQQSADIFTKLKVRKDQVPIKPLTEGKLE